MPQMRAHPAFPAPRNPRTERATRFFRFASVVLLLSLVCGPHAADSTASTPTAGPQDRDTGSTPVTQPDTASKAPPLSSAPARGLLTGGGELRKPEPFTLEQRLLAAVSKDDRRTIELALERGASVNSKDDIGRNTLFLAVLDAGDLDLVRWLRARGAAPDDADSGGRTALSFAAANGQLEIARYLVEQGAAIESTDIQRRTPLFHAVFGNHRDVAAFLLDKGANVNRRDQFGDTPLIVACAKGYGDMAAFLLQRGADPALKDQEGRSARERAAPGTEACLKSATP